MLTIMQEGLELWTNYKRDYHSHSRNAHHNAGGFRGIKEKNNKHSKSRNAHHNAGGFRESRHHAGIVGWRVAMLTIMQEGLEAKVV